jgi:predicted metal-dependent peptidase
MDKITIAIDVSGSVSRQEFLNMKRRAASLVSEYEMDTQFTVICFDTRVRSVHMYEGRNLSNVTDIGNVGGGGTDCDAVFDYVKLNDCADKLIFFTDYPSQFGDLPGWTSTVAFPINT